MRDTVFGEQFNNDAPVESPEELQRKDPLGITIWRYYSKTKNQLPNQERMDNLSWRMMSMNLKKIQEQEREKYG